MSALSPAVRTPARSRLELPARCIGIAAGLVLLGAVHLRHRPATICPFRACTGLPCPFCGGTTAAADIGRGRLTAALAASPLAVGLIAALPLARSVRMPNWWEQRHSLRTAVILVILGGSEAWQLVRFHVFG